MTFLRAVSAEFRKILTTRLWWVLALILFGYVGFSAAAIAFFLSLTPEEAAMPIPDDFLAPLVYSMATAAGYVLPIIFGAMSITSEVRHRTLGTVFLATPNRSVVLAAKAVAGFVVGAVYGVVALLGSVGLGAPVLAATGQETLLDDGDTWLMFGRIVLAMALWGLFGVSLGVLIPSQIGSIVTMHRIHPVRRADPAHRRRVRRLARRGRQVPARRGGRCAGRREFLHDLRRRGREYDSAGVVAGRARAGRLRRYRGRDRCRDDLAAGRHLTGCRGIAICRNWGLP